jgi:hypothetical protein
MSQTEIVVQGTLKPDGTLELDQKPNLAPGRVTVVLRQEAEATSPPQEDWFQFMLNARKKMEVAGCHFMDEQELQAHIDWLREGDRIDEMLREGDEQRRQTEQPLREREGDAGPIDGLPADQAGAAGPCSENRPS